MVGIVVLRLIRLVITPPAVSIPIESGATSSRSKSWILLDLSPVKIEAWTAAPYATASSGLMLLHSSLSLKNRERIDWIFGIRVEPPTSTTSWISFLAIVASLSTFSTTSNVVRKKSAHNSSNRARVIVIL